MDANAIGFPGGSVTFWLEGWQLESGEVPELTPGARYDLPLAFRWLTGPTATPGPGRIDAVDETGTYAVRGRHLCTRTRELLHVHGWPVSLVGDVFEDGKRSNQREPRDVRGTVSLNIPFGWADGWDEWTGGLPLPWPLFTLEVRHVRLGESDYAHDSVRAPDLEPLEFLRIDARVVGVVAPAVSDDA